MQVGTLRTIAVSLPNMLLQKEKSVFLKNKNTVKPIIFWATRVVKLAIVEAKSDELSVGEGVMQAKRLRSNDAYSLFIRNKRKRDLWNRYGNGRRSTCYRISNPENLWNRTFGDVNKWRDKFYAEPFYIDEGKKLRYYQEIAVNRVLEAIANEKTRILLTLATGTGKTMLAFQIAWKLYQTRWNISKSERRPRILFLADRNILANQAFNGFGGF